MKKYLRSIHPPASPEDIEEIERRFGLVLPLAYKDFLMRNNGGLCRLMDYFFLSVSDTGSSLSSAIYERADKTRLPIGNDMGGKRITIDMASGAVLLGNKKVADSFERFVAEFLVGMDE
ncbi:SMI1/KNR4 family protein [Luteolibacter arcticus]|uniref:SMI1/KNR4 family protein n=1 Tax=Luteolibacter arcticus TaxID=1581411 RepID=A0ABT3GM63_9BACT|nr:SMI1/KNR4 family protein [Luteolibacter arcticus]MCW1924607.1 SMI1/KNR4 family protein [Luteolibacter arcticus]